MKVGKRQQQGRTGKGLTGKKTKLVCPLCKEEYLQTFYGKPGLKRKGVYCPNDKCDYCKKDIEWRE